MSALEALRLGSASSIMEANPERCFGHSCFGRLGSVGGAYFPLSGILFYFVIIFFVIFIFVYCHRNKHTMYYSLKNNDQDCNHQVNIDDEDDGEFSKNG